MKLLVENGADISDAVRNINNAAVNGGMYKMRKMTT